MPTFKDLSPELQTTFKLIISMGMEACRQNSDAAERLVQWVGNFTKDGGIGIDDVAILNKAMSDYIKAHQG